MPTFEQGFADAETAADSVLKTLKSFTNLAGQLRKAARDGNISVVRRTSERLQDGISLIRQEVANAAEAWPFTPEEEQAYLQDQYASELRAVAANKGLDIFERDGVLISHPSIVRVLPVKRTVTIDKKQISTLRPSHLAGTLANNQKRPPRFRSEAFLEALYKAYQPFAKTLTVSRLIKEPVVPLSNIYDTFTSLPGSSREYGAMDFAKDLYSLERDGMLTTKSGARLSFPSSTGAKSPRGNFPFVGPDGDVFTYYGIQFSGGGS